MPARCIEFDTVRGTHKVPHELCLDKSRRVVYFRDDDRECFWSDYRSFGGKQLPGHAEMRERNIKVIDVDFTYIEIQALSPASIRVPVGLQPDSICRTKLLPALRSAPDPTFPLDAPRLNGTVVLAVLIGKDGSVLDSQVIQSLGKAYDREAQDAVKRWKYSPAQCDGQPEQAKTTVDINFRTR
jgi:TonB family protein